MKDQAGTKSFLRNKGLEGICLALVVSAAAEFLLNDFSSKALSVEYIAKISRIAVVFLLLYTVHRFAVVSLPKFRANWRDTMWLALVLVSSVLLVWIGRVVIIGIVNYPGTISLIGQVSPITLMYAIPYAAGALLVQAVLGIHFGLVFSLGLSIIIGVYIPEEPMLSLYVMITSLVACLSLSRFRSRSAYIRAGINVAIVAFPVALASAVVSGELGAFDLLFRLAGAVACGIQCAFLAAGLTPIVEYFGGYVTDMRLIEMATLDHPLLKELSIQAPGTWNHSMVIGMMVEAGAEAIGANAVISRVGAYFHDIGKMKKPLYFVENQFGEDNRHSKLSPSMSALIIRSHVKDGIELARKHKLPKVIEDMIPEHHGTNKIEFFYDKAVKEAKEEGHDPASIDVNLYTYPGPKPQTREAGLLMLADGIEAAARTLSEPNLDRIQGMVQKQINKIFASGELDQSDLTLRDLHLIAKSFTRVLNGIYHQRIAYAEPAEKQNEQKNSEQKSGETKGNETKAAEQKHGEAKQLESKLPKAPESKSNEPTEAGKPAKDPSQKSLEGGDSSEKRDKAKSEDSAGKAGSKEDLKRLGL